MLSQFKAGWWRQFLCISPQRNGLIYGSWFLPGFCAWHVLAYIFGVYDYRFSLNVA